MSEKLSVIIPVHNAAKTIRKTALGILNQNYRDLELLLVENGSTDDTWIICRDIAQSDKRCIALQSDVKSTLLARRMGIEKATGNYMTFSDADDRYKSIDSLGNMMEAIKRTGADIVQFGNVVNSFGRKENRLAVKEEIIIDRKQLLQEDIAGAMGGYQQRISPAIWNKLYRGGVLKSILPDLTYPLVYAEDLYINCCSCFSPLTNTYAFVPICEYVYNSGIGVSGDGIKAAEKTFSAYQYFKPKALELASAFAAGEKPIYLCQRETLRFLDSLIRSYIIRGDSRKQVCEKIDQLWTYPHVKSAKAYFIDYMKTHELDEEMSRFAKETDAAQYYDYSISRIGNLRREQILALTKSTLKQVLRGLHHVLYHG